MKLLLPLALLALFFGPNAIAAPGDLDPTFGNAGKVTTAIGSSGDIGRSVALDTTGKIIVAGSSDVVGFKFSLGRYNAEGSLDASFGTGGKVTTSVGNNDLGEGVAVQNDGKIVIAGYTIVGGNYVFALVRYNIDGSLDSGFGTGGKVTTSLGGTNDRGHCVAIQSDGKIVVAGQGSIGNSIDFAVVRYMANGILDSGFGTGGKVITPIGSSDDIGQSVAVQGDGKIVVAGFFVNAVGNSDFALVRYTAAGALDSGFGTGGKVTTPIGSLSDRGNSVAIQTDGKILVAGETDGGVRAIALVRYSVNGALDSGFGTSGKVTTLVGGSDSAGYCVATQTDGKIVVSGTARISGNYDVALLRYNGDGSLDNSFGTGGVVTTPVGSSSDSGRSVALQGDGKIVVAGSSINANSNDDFALVRYESGVVPPRVVTPTSNNVSSNTAILGAYVLGDGGAAIIQRGVVYAATVTNADPVIDGAGVTKVTASGDTGVFGIEVSGLSRLTGYTFKAYATSGAGTGYTNAATFATTADTPTVTAPASTSITNITATLGGNVASDGGAVITERGVVYAATVTNANPVIGGPGVTKLISSGTTGAFTISASGLSPSTSYTFKAYAINSGGAGYTNASAFTTRAPAPGDLDGLFGVGGKVATPIGSGDDLGYATVVQSDGKILVAGESYVGSNFDFCLARYNNNGSLDSSFGTGGKVITPVSSGSDYGRSVAIQSNGKIVVAGYSIVGTIKSLSLVRYNTNGSLDSGFGTGGKVTTVIGGTDDRSFGVVVQNDGKIVAAGQALIEGIYRFALVRYTTSGALDGSFGSGGKVTTAIGGGGLGRTVALQSNGKILVAGYSPIANTYEFVLVRYNADGGLDSAFGTDGKVITPIGSSDDYGRSMVVQSNGKIVVAGYCTNGFSYDLALVRYNADGGLDSNFGTGGKVITPVGSDDDYGYGVALQGDGKILVAGYSYVGSNLDFALTRYTAGGVLDNSFGVGGKVTTPVGSFNDYAYSVAVQSDGKIVVAGQSLNGGNYDMTLVRYAGGSLGDTDGDGLLDSWERTYWPTTTGHNATDDFDSDGIPELAEEAFGLDPTLPDAESVPQVVDEDGYLTMTLTKRPGVTYEVQSGGTLLSGQAESFRPDTTTVLTNNTATLKVRDNVPIANPLPRFMRVQVTVAP